MPVGFDNTTDPRAIAKNQRGLIQQRGDQLSQDEKDRAAQSEANSGAYLNNINDLENQYMAGQGGYTPGEAAGVTGDTSSWQQYYQPLTQEQQQSEATQRGAVSGMQQGLYDAANNPNLGTGDYGDSVARTVNTGDTSIAQGLNDTSGRVRGAIDPNALSQSSSANAAEQFGPEAQRALVTGAGISAGLKDQAAVDDTERSARAAGASPMGVAAYRARMARSQAIDSGNAMTQARAQAAQLGMQGATAAEGQRLAAQQNLTGTQVGSELQLGQNTTAAQQDAANRRVQAQQNVEQTQLASAQDIANREAQAAQVGGQTAIGTEQGIVGQRQGTSSLGVGAQQTADAQGSQRAQTIGNTRISQQNVGLAGQQATQAQQNQNAQNAYGRQQQTYSTQTGGTNDAASLGVKASQTPSTLDKVVGGVAGGLGAVASFLDDGDVATEPTLAVVGENGPEQVVPANNYRAKLQGAMKAAAPAIQSMSNPYRSRMAQSQGNDPSSPYNPWGDLAKNAITLGGNLLKGKGGDGEAEGAADGRVVTKPTLVMLGEDEPEAVVPIGYHSRAKARPSMMAV